MTLVFENHPYRALADFRKVALRCLHCSILSRVGASSKPGAVQIFADGGYAGPKLRDALKGQPVEVEIVKRTDKNGGYKVIRRRWVVERSLSCLRRNRRLMAQCDARAINAEGFAKLAMIAVMLRRLTEPNHHTAT
ncbi:MAG: transposase [Alphaproteobacteria bacterium]|nr:transposase [Alphaproteobacteria bacterium]